ncbi:MerR family transcriptional regulator, partial [Amedibacillus dolichus]
MKSYFTTGQFARLANVTERTIRYYDKQGLLKPSFIMENGYRKYSEDDFIRLQRIISLKQLGFSLNEIKMMDIDTNHTAMEESLQLQIDLLDKKIRHAQLLKDSLVQTKQLLRQGSFTWDKMVSVLQLNTEEEKIIEHYRDERHLSIRI